ncbi:MAG: ABC transporter ATP-binding protein [Deltaproteobacteria bacterium]|nr:MAG: ABC transporter ATP-binding protein [Deltaproteobacteria bacterium]
MTETANAEAANAELETAEDAEVLVLEDVVREFGDTVVTRVLHGISLRIVAGDFCSLTGPSGSGKSTLLHIMGLLDRPTSGSVRVQEVETAGMHDAERTRIRGETLGFIFQFHHLLPAFTALENIVLPSWLATGRRDRETDRRAAELLERVGLGDRRDAPIRELSGGQQQRVAIARALVRQPRLVLADEPTGNLDTESAAQVFSLLREIHAESGTAFVIVTHDPGIAARCDRALEIVDGRLT